MNWIVKTVIGAMLAGVGLKIGADVYEAVKKGVREVAGAGEQDGAKEEAREESLDDDLEAALETDVVDIDEAEEV